MKKLILLFIIVVALGVAIYLRSKPQLIKVDLPPPQNFEEFIVEEDIIEKEIVPEAEVEPIPELEPEPEPVSVNLAVPFTSQAPSYNWDQPFQDACEEASLIMIDYYYQNKELPSLLQIEDVLLDMIGWQQDNWGGHFNLEVSRVAEFAEIYYDYEIEIVEDLDTDKIENYLDRGLPIIIPADGHILDQPYFTNDGPDYHMLVIKGYVDGNFITNDPGTWRGADFIYSYENMMASIMDWDTKKASATGPKQGLVLLKK